MVKVIHRLRWEAKQVRKKVNPNERCRKCGRSIKNSVHHFYCKDCHENLPVDRPLEKDKGF